MRKTILHRTTLAVAVIFLGVAIILGIVRNNIAPPESHEHDHGQADAAELGAALFQDKGCSQCHLTDSRDARIGPGLQGLFERSKLPASGRSVTEDNVRNQFTDPYEDMPSFADRLSRKEIEHIISYLKTI